MLLRSIVIASMLTLLCSPVHAGSCNYNSKVTIVGQINELFKNQAGSFTLRARNTSPCYVGLVLTSFEPPRECKANDNWFTASGIVEEDDLVGIALDTLHAENISCQPNKPAQAVIPNETSEPRRTEASKETPVSHDQGHWFVIAGAWPQAESYKVKARVALLSGNNIAAKVINTDQYANLAPGLRAVVLGPTSREQAESQLATIRSIVPDAYIKEGF